MFDLRSFVLETILKMVGNVPEYKVREYALGWYGKEVLTDIDMVEIESKYIVEVPEETVEENVEPEENSEESLIESNA